MKERERTQCLKKAVRLSKYISQVGMESIEDHEKGMEKKLSEMNKCRAMSFGN